MTEYVTAGTPKNKVILPLNDKDAWNYIFYNTKIVDRGKIGSVRNVYRMPGSKHASSIDVLWDSGHSNIYHYNSCDTLSSWIQAEFPISAFLNSEETSYCLRDNIAWSLVAKNQFVISEYGNFGRIVNVLRDDKNSIFAERIEIKWPKIDKPVVYSHSKRHNYYSVHIVVSPKSNISSATMTETDVDYKAYLPNLPNPLKKPQKPEQYKFSEDKILKEIEAYIDGTYAEHYSGKYQATDMIIDSGHGVGFTMGSIMKYAKRYGKKGGYNRKDLLKIIHYAVIAMYIQDNYES